MYVFFICNLKFNNLFSLYSISVAFSKIQKLLLQ